MLATLALLLFAEAGDPAILRAARVAPDAVAIVVREGEVTLGGLVPYEPRPGDRIQEDGDPLRKRTLVRDGRPAGHVAGPEDAPQRFLRTPDRFSGRRADRKLLADAAAWSLAGPAAVRVTKVNRKTRCVGVAESGWWDNAAALEHTLVLRLDRPLPSGEWTVRSRDPLVGDFTAEITDDSESEAVHATLVGYRPADPGKIAWLSFWAGDGAGLTYEEPAFAVVGQDGREAFAGRATQWRWAGQEHDFRGLRTLPNGVKINTAGVTVYACEFSALTEPGTYRVRVEGVGSSRPFEIGEDVYARPFDLVREGLRAHRWGVTLDVPTVGSGGPMSRPAAVPKSHESYASVPVFDTAATYTNANFADFPPAVTGPHEGDVSGGYMDAGDFDRNFNHDWLSYFLLDLVEKHPGDRRLDCVLEDALWNLDLWRRLQRPDGGVPSAVEYREHPVKMEPSWLNSQAVYVCAPSPESTRLFAAAAAKASSALKALGRDEDAADYREAAEAAYAWTMKDGTSKPAGLITPTAELLKATGRDDLRAALLDQTAEFKEWTIAEPAAIAGLLTVCEAGGLGLPEDRRAVIEAAAKFTLRKVYLEGSSDRQPYRAIKHGWIPARYGSGTIPDTPACNLPREAVLFEDAAMLEASVAGLAHVLGANPLNTAYVTGLHERSPRAILHIDTRAAGRFAPAGVPVYGPTEPNEGSWPVRAGVLAGEQQLWPLYDYWPASENFHEYWGWAEMTEYTIHQSFTPTLYYAGLLGVR